MRQNRINSQTPPYPDIIDRRSPADPSKTTSSFKQTNTTPPKLNCHQIRIPKFEKERTLHEKLNN